MHRLRYYGDPCLRQRAREIEEITPEIQELAEEMIRMMVSHQGIGLAATQLGKMVRLFVIREQVLNEREQPVFKEPEVFINPVITSPSKDTSVMVEGCLSLPGVQVEVERPEGIHIRYQNLAGEWKEESVHTFRGRIMMHENDHLNGVLIIDRMSSQEKQRVKPLLYKIKKKHPPKKSL